MNLVVDFVDANGNWRWASFEHLLPNCIILRISVVQPPMEGKGDDKCFWASSQWGDFSVKSAYMAVTENETGIENSRWNIAWKWKGPPRVQTFIWLALHDRLKTKVEIGRRHIHIDWTCDQCGVASETTLHVLRDCFMARRLWNQLLPSGWRQPFFSSNLNDWLTVNLRSNQCMVNGLEWSCVFGVAIWRLWFWQNQNQFNKISTDSTSMAQDVLMRANEITSSNKFGLNGPARKVKKWIGWQPPARP